MSNEEKLEGNKLIAEFMGLRKMEDGRYEGLYEKNVGIFPQDKLGYHEYWNWLMPVVEKIEEGDYSVEITEHKCAIHKYSETKEDFEPIIIVLSDNKIEATYNAIIEFLTLGK